MGTNQSQSNQDEMLKKIVRATEKTGDRLLIIELIAVVWAVVSILKLFTH